MGGGRVFLALLFLFCYEGKGHPGNPGLVSSSTSHSSSHNALLPSSSSSSLPSTAIRRSQPLSQSTLIHHSVSSHTRTISKTRQLALSLSIPTTSRILATSNNAASTDSRSLASNAALLSASVASAVSASQAAASETNKPVDCNDGTWNLTPFNYQKHNTDANLQIWWNGGTDNETGVSFPRKKAPGTFLTEALAASFEPVGEQFLCTLEQHSCQPADGCASKFSMKDVSLRHQLTRA